MIPRAVSGGRSGMDQGGVGVSRSRSSGSEEITGACHPDARRVKAAELFPWGKFDWRAGDGVHRNTPS